MKYKYSIAINGKFYKFSNHDKLVLLSQVSEFLRDNNIIFSEADLLKAIERQSKISEQKKKLSFKQAVYGANALIRYAGGDSVSYKEIERRSSICSNCPLISEVEKCGPCGTAGKIARFIGEMKTKLKLSYPIPEEIKYSYCGVCDCSLALMTVTKIENFHKESNLINERRPDCCWLKTTSKNYSNE